MIGLEGALCRKESPQMYGSSLCGGQHVTRCLHICECVYSEGWQEEEWAEQHLRMWAIVPVWPRMSLISLEQQQALSERPKNRLITRMAAFQLLRKKCLQQPTVPPVLEEKLAHRVLWTQVHISLQRLHLCSTSFTLEGGFYQKGPDRVKFTSYREKLASFEICKVLMVGNVELIIHLHTRQIKSCI